jgi:hypothetical protein
MMKRWVSASSDQPGGPVSPGVATAGVTGREQHGERRGTRAALRVADGKVKTRTSAFTASPGRASTEQIGTDEARPSPCHLPSGERTVCRSSPTGGFAFVERTKIYRIESDFQGKAGQRVRRDNPPGCRAHFVLDRFADWQRPHVDCLLRMPAQWPTPAHRPAAGRDGTGARHAHRFARHPRHPGACRGA